MIVCGIDEQWQMDLEKKTKRKPADVMIENEKQVWHMLYGDHDDVKHPMYKFKISDQVRISKIKRTFDKGYPPNFSKEIFTVSKQVHAIRPCTN